MNMSLASSIIHQNHLAVLLQYSSCINKNSSLFIRLCNTKSCVAVAKKKDHVAFRTWAINTNPPLHNSKLISDEEDMMMRRKFEEVYWLLKSELLNDPCIQWTHDSRQWLNQMMDYNVPGGKIARGLSVIDSYKSLKKGKELSEDEVFDACVVGWCMEWLQACALMLDDIMDNSHTRRGQPCWFRIPKVGKIAINDGIVLGTQISRILKKHFSHKPYYVDLLDLFGEVNFETASGQMLDIITTGRHKDLSNYSLHLYRHIAQYKTGFYTFYLPVACALLLAGENRDEHENVKDVLLDMGIYFQIVDDYLDCFGDPEKTGKSGSDIEDLKCSWLVVKALELSNQQHKIILYEHYGKANPNDVAKVKAVYNELNLRDVFLAFERESYDKITTCVEAHPNKAVLRAIWARTVCWKHWL